jgi:hypothetical protein
VGIVQGFNANFELKFGQMVRWSEFESKLGRQIGIFQDLSHPILDGSNITESLLIVYIKLFSRLKNYPSSTNT